jgi:hypothetical protein
MEEFFYGKLGDCVEAGEGASNQLHGSSKIDAPAMISVLDIESASQSFIFLRTAKKQEPDREETGRALVSLIAAAARRFGRQRSGFMFIEQFSYPTVTDSPSIECMCHEGSGTNRKERKGRIEEVLRGSAR